MNLNNFVVRPQRRLVEKYARPEAWTTLKDDDRGELTQKVAGLPTEAADEDEDAKRFDLLMLRLQLTLLRSEPGFERLRDQVKAIAGVLEEKSAIPMVRDQMALIQEIQTDEYWQDVTAPLLDVARKRLRALLKLIEKSARKIVYTDFEDEMGGEIPVALPGFGTGADFERFRIKARVFLREHESHVARPRSACDQSRGRFCHSANIGSHAESGTYRRHGAASCQTIHPSHFADRYFSCARSLRVN